MNEEKINYNELYEPVIKNGKPIDWNELVLQERTRSLPIVRSLIGGEPDKLIDTFNDVLLLGRRQLQEYKKDKKHYNRLF